MPPDDRSDDRATSQSPVAKLHALEHRVEDAVEEVLHVAERSLARRFGDGCVHGIRVALRTLWISLIVAYFAFGALWLATRYYLMPHIDEYRPLLEREVSRALDTRVTIARIDSGWRGFNPQLRLVNVQIFDRGGNPVLALPQLEATLSWRSLPALQVQFSDLWIRTPELDVQRQADGSFVVAGFVIDPRSGRADSRAAEWVLSQAHIGIRDARVRYRDAAIGSEAVELQDVDFDFRRGLVSDRFALRVRPPASLSAPIDLRGEYRRPWFGPAADVSQWSGRVFAQTDYADVARVAQLAHALPATMSIDRAQGAVRAWLEFDRGRIERSVADLALVDVSARLGAGLEPLQVDQLQGRLEQREWGTLWGEGGQEFSVRQLALTGSGLALPPTDARVRITRAADGKPVRGLIEASGLSLTTVSALAAHLPLPAPWHKTAQRFGVRGDLANLRYTWEGEADAPKQYALQTDFAGLSMNGEPADPPLSPRGRPRPGRPGFQNFAGTLQLDPNGGNAQVRARDALLDFPGVFEATVPLTTLKGNARWSTRDGFELKLDSVVAANSDFEIGGQATYRSGGKGIGIIDASGQIVRAEASQVHKMIPLVVSPAVRTWLGTALVAGTARDGSFKLKGDLADFPFAQPASGEFRVAAKIEGGTLDYLPQRASDSGAAPETWPPITNIDGDFLFERHKIEITARRAQVFGVQLGPVRATLPDLGAADVRLMIDGKGSGPLGDLLRFVTSSPVGGWLGGFLAHAEGSGTSGLDLQLDIPLKHAQDTRVRGAIALANDDLVLQDDLPPFTRVSGKVEFSEKSVRIAGLGGTFAGGPFRVDTSTRADGALEIAATGTASAQAAQRLVEGAALQRLLGRAQGSARYSAGIVVRNRRADIRVTSDLVGIGLDLPDPLRKSAADAMPLRVEIVPRDAGDRTTDADTIRVAAGSRLALALDRSRNGNGVMHIERGALAIGDGNVDALPLPESGIRATVTAQRLDLDRWLPLLDGATADGEGAVALDSVSANVRELVIGGKSFANVVLGATRMADGQWLANVNSDHASGALTWQPRQAGKQGRVSARLTRLTIPEQSRAQLTEFLDAPPTDLPAVDLVASEFELVGHKLGRLELQAQNVGNGPNAVWQVQKLEFTNPDGHMTASGQWQRATEGRQRRMALNLVLDFSDAGNLLARFGMPGAMRGGEGKIEGDIAWRGSPLSIDYPSLSGNLKLSTAKGQFLKADAGVARLLGVLSLQSLPRRIALDFRDVFSEGFAFDSITASADVSAGVLSTRDFKMRGPNATVLIEGSADLRQETQNLHVLVLPEVNAGSASLAYALLANPAIGLGTFLAQWVLRDPLSKAFSHEFDVTGSWSDPQVKRRERSPEVAGSAAK